MMIFLFVVSNALRVYVLLNAFASAYREPYRSQEKPRQRERARACARVYLSFFCVVKNEEFFRSNWKKNASKKKCRCAQPLPVSRHQLRAAAAAGARRRRIPAPNQSSSPRFLRRILADTRFLPPFQPLGVVVIARGTSSLEEEDNCFLLLLLRFPRRSGEGTKGALWCGRWRRQKLRVVEIIKMATMRTFLLLLPR